MASTLTASSPPSLAEQNGAGGTVPMMAHLPRRGVRARDVEVDLDAHLVRVRERSVVMTALELRLCSLLVANAGRVLTRAELAQCGWGDHTPPKKALDVYMSRIRRRLGPDREGRPYIRTVRSIGYIFDE